MTATPVGVGFEITLYRDCDYESRLWCFQGLAGDRQKLRQEAIARSLENKCPKLKEAHDNGCISVLVLESDDISLANRVAVAQAVSAELAKRIDQPDVVIWVRTSTQPWRAALLKDGDQLYPEIDAQLFDL